jgi:hypothetical protein
MLTASPRVLVTALVVLVAACSDKTAAPAAADASTPTGPPESYESVRGNFVLTLPAAFRGNYRVKESADTILGARFAAEIVYPADSAGKIPSRTILVVRVFTKASWEKLSGTKGFAGALKRAERGDDVFTLSMITSNPYKFESAPARMVDRMMLAATTGGLHIDITPR